MSGLNLKIECGSDEPFVVNSRMVDSVLGSTRGEIVWRAFLYTFKAEGLLYRVSEMALQFKRCSCFQSVVLFYCKTLPVGVNHGGGSIGGCIVQKTLSNGLSGNIECFLGTTPRSSC